MIKDLNPETCREVLKLVKIKLFGIPGFHLNRFNISIENPVAFSELIKLAFEQSSVDLGKILLKDGKIEKKYFILLNGKRIDEMGNLEASISPGDTLIINRMLLGG